MLYPYTILFSAYLCSFRFPPKLLQNFNISIEFSVAFISHTGSGTCIFLARSKYHYPIEIPTNLRIVFDICIFCVYVLPSFQSEVHDHLLQ